MHHSTSREKKDPKGGPEIIRAACLFSKRRTIASLLTGLVDSAQSSGDRATGRDMCLAQLRGQDLSPSGSRRQTIPQRAWRAEDPAERDYSQVWRSHEACFAWFWTCLGPVAISFFPISLGMGMSLLLLPQQCTLETCKLVCFHRFAAEDKFCLRMNST